jgi:hypothetical protein
VKHKCEECDEVLWELLVLESLNVYANQIATCLAKPSEPEESGAVHIVKKHKENEF